MYTHTHRVLHCYRWQNWHGFYSVVDLFYMLLSCKFAIYMKSVKFISFGKFWCLLLSVLTSALSMYVTLSWNLLAHFKYWLNFHSREGETWSRLLVPAPALTFHDLDATYCLFITCTQQVSDYWMWMYNGESTRAQLIALHHRSSIETASAVWFMLPADTCQQGEVGVYVCVCFRLMRCSRWWGTWTGHTPQGERAGKQVHRCFARSIAAATFSLMISTTSSTAEMVTQGKFQVNAVDTVEGKDFLWSFKSACFTFSVITFVFL